MANIAERRVAFSRGEIDPLLVSRDDLDGLKAGCSFVSNYMPLPQGGLERRWPMAHCDYMRGPLQPVEVEASFLAAPNGGTSANAVAIDGQAFVTTGNLNTNAAYVALTVTFPAPRLVHLVDVIDAAIVAAGGGGGGDIAPLPPPPGPWPWEEIPEDWDRGRELAAAHMVDGNDSAMAYGVDATAGDAAEIPRGMVVQYLDAGGVWRDFGPRLGLGVAVRSRRFGIGPRRGMSASQWRVLVDATAGGGARVVRLDAIRFWAEQATISPDRLRAFTLGDDSGAYIAALTAGNIEIFQAGRRVGSAACDLGASAVLEVDVTQSLDTMIVCHPSIAPLQLMRQGSAADWDFRPAVFENVPIYDFTGAKTGGVNEVQMLRFVNYVAGETFNLTVEDYTTGGISYGGSGAATAAAVQSALQALPNIGPGGVVCAAGSGGANTLSITFQNQCGAQDWGEVVPKSIQTATGGVVTSTLTQGEAGGEAKMSAARGWPRCAAFYSQRLWLGGFWSLPETLVASRTGDYYNLRTKGALDSSAIDVSIDTDQVTAIRRIFPGRALVIFTSSAEFWWSNEPPSPRTPGIKSTTRHGILATAAPIEIDGAVMFVPRSAAEVLQLVWNDAEQTFATEAISTLSAHLIKDVIDIGFRRRRTSAQPDLIVLPQQSGAAIGVSVMRNEGVQGFFRVATQGQVRSVAGEEIGDLYVTVQRGTTARLERWTNEACTDASVRVMRAAGGPALSVLTGLDHLNGMTVALVIDGEDTGRFVVTGGQLSLPRPALEWAEAGLPFEAEIELLPIYFDRFGNNVGTRGRAGSKAQGSGLEVRASVTARRFEARTQGGSRWWPMALRKMDRSTYDLSGTADQADGWVARISGMPGWSEEGRVRLRCLEQAPHIITSVAIKGIS